ncbi:hypothetical protein [Actinoplanes sp. NPDC051411]|uniref:hypothetical protein n=1 Tax=Actinoplanes sp. NPDC051411 TaxID=3155522 RepID=UPI003412E59D
MTMPAEITSDQAWDRLVVASRAQFHGINDLYHRIAEPDARTDQPIITEGMEPMTDPTLYPYPGYDPGADQRAAEFDDEQRQRDDETTSELDAEQDNEPDLEG